MGKKITLEFNIEEPSDEKDFEQVMRAKDMACALWEVGQKTFRPARKHGYENSAISGLIQKLNEASENYYSNMPEHDRPHTEEVIRLLEVMFYEILSEYGVNLDDLIY